MWTVQEIPTLCITICHEHQREVVYPIVSLRDEYQESAHLCCVNKVVPLYKLARKHPWYQKTHRWVDVWPQAAITALHNYLENRKEENIVRAQKEEDITKAIRNYSSDQEETMKKEKKVQTINEESREIFKRIIERHCHSAGIQFQVSRTVVQGNFTIVSVDLIVPDMDGNMITGLGASKRSHLDTPSKVGILLAFSRAVHNAVQIINSHVSK